MFNKIFKWISKASKNYIWNLSIIVLFSIFAIIDYSQGYTMYGILETSIVILECFGLYNNLKRKDGGSNNA